MGSLALLRRFSQSSILFGVKFEAGGFKRLARPFVLFKTAFKHHVKFIQFFADTQDRNLGPE